MDKAVSLRGIFFFKKKAITPYLQKNLTLEFVFLRSNLALELISKLMHGENDINLKRLFSAKIGPPLQKKATLKMLSYLVCPQVSIIYE